MPHARSLTNLESLTAPHPNRESVLRTQREARYQLLQLGDRNRLFTALNAAIPVPTTTSTELPTPTRTPPVATNHPLQVPGSHHSLCDEQPADKPLTTAWKEVSAPVMNDNMDAQHIREIVPEKLPKLTTSDMDNH